MRKEQHRRDVVRYAGLTGYNGLHQERGAREGSTQAVGESGGKADRRESQKVNGASIAEARCAERPHRHSEEHESGEDQGQHRHFRFRTD